MRNVVKKPQFLVSVILLTACFALAATMTLTPVKAAEKTPKYSEVGQGQTQRMCPPAEAPGTAACMVSLDCPPIKSPGKTVCQATIDCPPATPAGPAKGKQKK